MSGRDFRAELEVEILAHYRASVRATEAEKEATWHRKDSEAWEKRAHDQRDRAEMYRQQAMEASASLDVRTAELRVVEASLARARRALAVLKTALEGA